MLSVSYMYEEVILHFQSSYIPILLTLLDNGALLCSQDNEGVTPLQILQSKRTKINVMKYISLKCLAVKVLKDFKIKANAIEVGHHCASLYNLHE